MKVQIQVKKEKKKNMMTESSRVYKHWNSILMKIQSKTNLFEYLCQLCHAEI